MTNWIKGRIVGKKQWNDRLFSLLIDAPFGDFKAGQFTKFALDIGEDRVGRPYSLVNPPHERPLEIYFTEVPEGPLTPRLSDLDIGDPLWLDPKPNGMLTVDQVHDCKHLWLLATGTALGVFLSILRTAEPWNRFERIVLVHGVRTTDELAYREEIESIIAEHGDRFTFVSTLSRESQPGSLNGRITTLLESGELERAIGLSINPQDSHAMLCGNAEMINDVRALLEARGMRRNGRKEPGHYTTEQYH